MSIYQKNLARLLGRVGWLFIFGLSGVICFQLGMARGKTEERVHLFSRQSSVVLEAFKAGKSLSRTTAQQKCRKLATGHRLFLLLVLRTQIAFYEENKTLFNKATGHESETSDLKTLIANIREILEKESSVYEEMPCNETYETSEHWENFVTKCRETLLAKGSVFVSETDADLEKNAAANELFSLPELPDGVVGDLARMFRSADEDEVWRDYCLQFLGSALEREDGVTDEDRALARETLVEALASTNATFAGTALRALHRGDPADPLVASNALRIARDPSYPSASRITALLILEECIRSTAWAVAADPSASSLLLRTAEAVLERNAD